MQIQTMRIDELSADPANVRKHDERNIETIMGSNRRFGQQKPIVVDKSGVVRAGNGQLEAARRLGWETIEVHVSELQGSEMVAYAIADNRTAELAEWDDEILAAELNRLMSDDESLVDAAGFSESDLEALLPPEEPTKISEIVVQKPPAMSWVLLGISTVRFGEIASDVERLATIVEVCETTSNDG